MKSINNYISEKLVINRNTKLPKHYTYNDITTLLESIHEEWFFDEITWDDFDIVSKAFRLVTNNKFINKVYDIYDELKNDNIYVIHDNETEKRPILVIIFFDKNPFTYIIFYKDKFSELIESYTPADVKDEIHNFIK